MPKRRLKEQLIGYIQQTVEQPCSPAGQKGSRRKAREKTDERRRT